jgi:hypothetical protein
VRSSGLPPSVPYDINTKNGKVQLPGSMAMPSGHKYPQFQGLTGSFGLNHFVGSIIRSSTTFLQIFDPATNPKGTVFLVLRFAVALRFLVWDCIAVYSSLSSHFTNTLSANGHVFSQPKELQFQLQRLRFWSSPEIGPLIYSCIVTPWRNAAR